MPSEMPNRCTQFAPSGLGRRKQRGAPGASRYIKSLEGGQTMIRYAKILLVSALLCPISVIAATVDWSWRFNEPNVLANTKEDLEIYITVRNEPSSVDSIILRDSAFSLADGTFGNFGIFFDASNNPLYTAALLSPPDIILNPGEEISFLGFILAHMNGLKVGDQVFINPLYYVDSGFQGQHAYAGLIVNMSAVPIPQSLYLLMSGLGVICIKSRKGWKGI